MSRLEPLEEDDMEEEEGEEAGEEEEEEEEGEVRMQTPHLTQRSPKSTPKQSTIKSSSSRLIRMYICSASFIHLVPMYEQKAPESKKHTYQTPKDFCYG